MWGEMLLKRPMRSTAFHPPADRRRRRAQDRRAGRLPHGARYQRQQFSENEGGVTEQVKGGLSFETIEGDIIGKLFILSVEEIVANRNLWYIPNKGTYRRFCCIINRKEMVLLKNMVVYVTIIRGKTKLTLRSDDNGEDRF